MTAGILIGIIGWLLLICACWLIVAAVVDEIASRTAGRYTIDHREIGRRKG